MKWNLKSNQWMWISVLLKGHICMELVVNCVSLQIPYKWRERKLKGNHSPQQHRWCGIYETKFNIDYSCIKKLCLFKLNPRYFTNCKTYNLFAAVAVPTLFSVNLKVRIILYKTYIELSHFVIYEWVVRSINCEKFNRGIKIFVFT